MAKPGLARDDVDFLSLLGDANRRRVLERSTQGVCPAGALAVCAGDPPAAFVLDRGLVRAYWSAPDGRQATVAFFHTHDLIGGVTVMNRPILAFAQVVVESTLTTLDLETVGKVAAIEIEVLRAIATHQATQIRHAIRLIAVRSLGNITERLAYDLLDRACQHQLMNGRLEAMATQADLAASIGSSREVVGRAMKELRLAGIIKTAPGAVRVVDAMRLAATVRAFVF